MPKTGTAAARRRLFCYRKIAADDAESETAETIVRVRRMVPAASPNVKMTSLIPKGDYGIGKMNIDEYGQRYAKKK
ncbi:MAG: hypothetical protein LBT46_09755 [Planctomycetaceae bacterium]|nr:hypothetical protein [Planctomycetaceae bacterium]